MISKPATDSTLSLRPAYALPTHLSRSAFNCMNVAAVFAPEKVYECSGSVAFNCVFKFQFAAATRTIAHEWFF